MELDAAEIRLEVMKMIVGKGKGHSGGALSIVDILTSLYFGAMNVDPHQPLDPHRDRFLLSKGHAATALYATLARRGYFPLSTLATYCELGSHLGGHPTHGLPGVEVATGALGHGPALGLGMALAAKVDNKEYRVFVLVGDGEIQEGAIWEAAFFAAHHALDNFVMIVDRNRIQSDGFTEDLLAVEPLRAKFLDFGWSSREVDGHSVRDLTEALGGIPFEAGKPSLLVANTVKGKGVDFIENEVTYHNRGPVAGSDEARSAFDQLERCRDRLAVEVDRADR